MSYRMRTRDTVYARNHVMVGPLGTLTVWVYDRPVDMPGLAAFHTALTRGRLARVAAPAVVGPAGDRWSDAARFVPLEVAATTLPRAGLGEWMTARARDELRPYGGPAWRLTVAPLEDGGSAVSLLVAHAVADGMLLMQAIADAVHGRGIQSGCLANGHATTAGARSGLADLAPAVVALGRGSVALAGQLADAVRSRRDGASFPPTAEIPPLPDGFTIPRLTVRVVAAQWLAAAQALGGTATTLAVALIASLAARLGRVDRDGRALVAMPVSIRDGASDQRANAITAVEFPVDTADLGVDLRPARATMKATLRDSAASTRKLDRVDQVDLMYPRSVRARRARKPPVLDLLTVECAVLGRLDPAVACIDGSPATTVAYSLVAAEWDNAARVAARGGILRVDSIELGDAVVLRLLGLHPQNPLNRTQFREVVVAVLDGYGLRSTVL